MTDKIAETLNLPTLKELIAQNEDENNEACESEDHELMKKIAAMDPSKEIVLEDEGIDDHIKEMDKVYKLGMDAHSQTFDLALNMEPKNSGPIFEQSARFLEAAMNASKFKMDSRQKRIKMMMDRERLDHHLGKDKVDGYIVNDDDDSTISTRSDLLNKIKRGQT